MASHLQSLPQVQAPGSGDGASAVNSQSIPSEIPAPPTKFSAKEKKIWVHVTKALHEYGLIHLTDSMALAVICRTFVRWVDAEEKLDQLTYENGGTYIVATPNGYEQPHQLFFVVRSLKKELLQWLPEAALTIPSFAKAIESRQAPTQGTLFDDPVAAHRKGKPTVPLRSVS